MAKRTRPTAERVRHLFRYEPDTGLFFHSNPHPRKRYLTGRVAGSIGRSANGYPFVSLNIDAATWKGHRIAWLYMTGEWPELEIDHWDGDPLNNRWRNLRLATSQQNSENMHHAHADSQSGYLGVSLTRSGRRYRSRIFVCGREVGLGVYATAEEAHEAYLAAKRRMHEFNTL